RTTSFNYTRQNTTSPYLHTAAFAFAVTTPNTVTNIADDWNFRKWIVREGFGTADDAWTTFLHDAVGNLTTVIAPNEQAGQQLSTITSYDERNRPYQIKDPLGKITAIRYDAGGRKAQVTRPNGQVITYNSYDAMNRLTQQTVKQTPEPDAVTYYTYDPSGGL